MWGLTLKRNVKGFVFNVVFLFVSAFTGTILDVITGGAGVH